MSKLSWRSWLGSRENPIRRTIKQRNLFQQPHQYTKSCIQVELMSKRWDGPSRDGPWHVPSTASRTKIKWLECKDLHLLHVRWQHMSEESQRARTPLIKMPEGQGKVSGTIIMGLPQLGAWENEGNTRMARCRVWKWEFSKSIVTLQTATCTNGHMHTLHITWHSATWLNFHMATSHTN